MPHGIGGAIFLPEVIEHMVVDGGFVLGPFGGPVHQRLLKRERQGEMWFDTDLGGVVFGPMDVGESESGPLDPDSLANHIEDAFDLVGGLVERDGMTPDEAIEFFNFNIECAYVGEYTPIYMYEE